MAFLAMPLLVINLGGEMIYILRQRLKAQNIAFEKSQKVLIDVAKAMLSTNFIVELFTPKFIYSNKSTRQLFDRLAHSSIMRLNESSMDKLYDLMTMGFKYQVMSCSSPDQILHVTLNHLESIKTIVNNEEITQLVESAISRTIETYASLSKGDNLLLLEQLCRFFQDRKVKISLFLQEGMQNSDGSLVLFRNGKTATKAEIPGNIRYYDDDGTEIRTSHFTCNFQMNSEGDNPVQKTCALGLNIYMDNSSSPKKMTSSEQLIASSKAYGLTKDSKLNEKRKPTALKSTATAELNLLANLLGSPTKEVETDSKAFKINLFSQDTEDLKDMETDVPMVYIKGGDRKAMSLMMEELDFNEEKKSDGKKVDDDDLLGLMLSQ